MEQVSKESEIYKALGNSIDKLILIDEIKLFKRHPGSRIDLEKLKINHAMGTYETVDQLKIDFRNMCLETMNKNPPYMIIYKKAIQMLKVGLGIILESVQFEGSEDSRPCIFCKTSDDPNQTLLCDCCNDPYHMSCLAIPLKKIPKGLWFCPPCRLIDQNQSLINFLEKRKKDKKSKSKTTTTTTSKSLVEPTKEDLLEPIIKKPKKKKTPTVTLLTDTTEEHKKKVDNKSTITLPTPVAPLPDPTQSLVIDLTAEPMMNHPPLSHPIKPAKISKRISKSIKSKVKSTLKRAFPQSQDPPAKRSKVNAPTALDIPPQPEQPPPPQDHQVFISPIEPIHLKKVSTSMDEDSKDIKPLIPRAVNPNTKSYVPVLKLTGRRLRSGMLQFKIKWYYPEYMPCWVYASDMVDCEDIIQKFETRYQDRIESKRLESKASQMKNNKEKNVNDN